MGSSTEIRLTDLFVINVIRKTSGIKINQKLIKKEGNKERY
jgi:hypothetical protein